MKTRLAGAIAALLLLTSCGVTPLFLTVLISDNRF